MKQTQAGSDRAEGYTFGVEIECFVPETAVRRYGIRTGAYHHPEALPHPFPEGWGSQRDGSLQTTSGGMIPMEMVSGILRGAEGIESVKRMARLLVEIGARVNPTCGLHVHVGADTAAGGRTWVPEWVGKLLYQTAMHEKALYASTGTTRREATGYGHSMKWENKELADEINGAAPGRKPEALRRAVDRSERQRSLNLQNLFTYKATVEFRAFAGTVEWKKIVGHVCMALALCERATETSRMNWNAVPSEKTYLSKGEGTRAIERFFYLTGWTLGRRQIGQPVCRMAGWIAPLEDLAEVKAELLRLARKYDDGGAH